jgi:hypothetical protein
LKKLILFGLLFFLLLQAGGLLVVFRLQQQIIRNRMARMIESEPSNTESLTISLEEYEASRVDRREILYKGHLFDIVSIQYTQNGVELKVIPDYREEAVAGKVRILEEQEKNRQKQDLPEQVLKFYSQVYLSPVTHDNPLIPAAIETKYPVLREDNYFIYGKTLSPPPRTI